MPANSLDGAFKGKKHVGAPAVRCSADPDDGFNTAEGGKFFVVRNPDRLEFFGECCADIGKISQIAHEKFFAFRVSWLVPRLIQPEQDHVMDLPFIRFRNRSASDERDRYDEAQEDSGRSVSAHVFSRFECS